MPNRDRNESFLETKNLLKQYRRVKYAVHTAETELGMQVRADYGILFNLSGENAELADTDLSGSSPEEYKRSVARSKKILHAMVDALELIKENPDRGDEMYEVLYQTYFTPQKPRNREVILKQLAIKGYPISSSQYHAWLKESISAIDELLWGFTAKGSPEFASLLSDT